MSDVPFEVSNPVLAIARTNSRHTILFRPLHPHLVHQLLIATPALHPDSIAIPTRLPKCFATLHLQQSAGLSARRWYCCVTGSELSREVLPAASLPPSEVQRSLSSQRSRLQTLHCTCIKHSAAQRQPVRTSVVREARTLDGLAHQPKNST